MLRATHCNYYSTSHKPYLKKEQFFSTVKRLRDFKRTKEELGRKNLGRNKIVRTPEKILGIINLTN